MIRNNNVIDEKGQEKMFMIAVWKNSNNKKTPVCRMWAYKYKKEKPQKNKNNNNNNKAHTLEKLLDQEKLSLLDLCQ